MTSIQPERRCENKKQNTPNSQVPLVQSAFSPYNAHTDCPARRSGREEEFITGNSDLNYNEAKTGQTFVEMKIESGKDFSWRISYDFYLLP
jgi:hypothetical protein